MNVSTHLTDRLPKWAREHISLLTRELAAERAQNTAILAGQTNIAWVDGIDKGPFYLPNSARIRFMLNDEWGEVIDVSLSYKLPRIRISSTGGRMMGLRIIPEAHNTAYIELGP